MILLFDKKKDSTDWGYDLGGGYISIDSYCKFKHYIVHRPNITEHSIRVVRRR